MVYFVLATFGFLCNWIILRSRILEYSIAASFIYLVSFVFIQSFDVLYAEYIIFFSLPHFGNLQKISKRDFAFIVYIFAEFLTGIIHEPVTSVLAAFLTRYFPLLFVFLIRKENCKVQWHNREYEQWLLRTVVACEIIISALLLAKGKRGDYFVVSHQPVGANLSLIGIFLAMDISLKSGIEYERHKYENILHVSFFTLLAIFSGIRGYIIIVIPCAFFSLIAYFLPELGERKVGLFLIGVITFGILSIAYVANGGLVTAIANIDTYIGYREMENRFCIRTLLEANPIRWLFGYGIGARGERIGSDTLIHSLSQGYIYYVNHLSKMTILLNFWLTVAKDMGVVGVIIYITMYFKIMNKRVIATKERKNGWKLYSILYAIMLLYRTSCTNGLIELYVFAMIVNNPVLEERSSC